MATPTTATTATAATARVAPVAASGTDGEGPGVRLVGRRDELVALRAAARRAAAGSGGAVVVSGEAGIGKTRLVEELAASAEDGAFAVAWARCQESASSAPYWGYTQIAEQLLAAGVISDTARDGISAAGGGVHTIDPAADRTALHSSMLAALRSATRPLLIVVDDLQWADASSLRALEFVASALPALPVLLVATVRPVGPESSAPLAACLAELARVPGAHRVELAGLTAADVATWLRRRDERVPAAGAAEVGALVHERTGGNPFFVGEVVELLAGHGDLGDAGSARRAGVPAAALDVVRRRVGLLPADTQRLLAEGSVMGVVLDLDLLAHVTGMSTGEALDVLDPAVDARLLVEDASQPGRVRFAHALVADALVAELSLARRARLHAAVVAAIEDLRPTTLDAHLPALVHHAREGAVAGVAPQAFAYAMRAARAATDRLAHEVAAGYWDDARGLLDLAHPGDARRRHGVLVELGLARRHADDLSGSQDALLDAVDVAEAMGDGDAVLRAARALAATSLWQTSPYGEVDERLVATLERVIAGLGPRSDVERASLLGALADAVYYEGDGSRSLELAAEAVAAARRTGDPHVVVLALSQRFRALWRDVPPEDDQRAIAQEMVDLAAEGDVHPGLAAVAHATRAVVAISRGDRPTFEADLARSRERAEAARLNGLVSQLGWADASWALALGAYDDAGEAARQAHVLYRRTRAWDADEILTSYEVSIAHDRGALGDPVSEALPLFGGRFGDAARELVAWMLTEDGRLDDARELIGPEGTVPSFRPDWLWAQAMTAAAHVRAALGDRVVCAAVYERLAPCAGRLDLAAGPFLGGIDLALAELADALGDAAGARRHAADAVALLDRVGARPALARALLCQGRLLAASPDATDRDLAAAALDRARRLASELGLVPVLAALDGMQAGSKYAGA